MKRMHSLYYSLVIIGLADYTAVQAQSTLYLKATDGTQTTILLSDIRKLTFPSGKIQINKTDGILQTVDFTDLLYLSFDDFNIGVTLLESQKKEDIILYPTPASKDLTIKYKAIESGKVQITIIDILGQIVYTEIRQKHIGENQSKIDISQISNGLYMLCFYDGFVLESKKLIISK